MQSAVALNNALVDAMAKMPAGSAKLDLPMFVVVGAQSSGKSSVLDNVIGRSFLPRGSGTVTRRPLVLMMQCTRDCADEYAEFSHLKGQRFTTDAQITAAIERATEDECGPRGFSSKPIHLHYYSPNVPDLTLVDLPGVIKAAARDMDPTDPQTIRSMVMEFATKPNSILLAVTPAVADLVTSDAIQLAREVDPNGQRTLGVLTKLDLMDEGTDCAAALAGDDPRAPKLRLGYVGVVNRGQKDINLGVDLTAARQREQTFFAEHETYRHLVGQSEVRLGTQALVDTSSALLVEHIEHSLPELKTQILAQLNNSEASLAKLAAVAEPERLEKALCESIAFARSMFAAQINPSTAINVDHLRMRAYSAGHDIESIFVGLMQELKAETTTYNFGELELLTRKMAGAGGMLFDVDHTFRLLVRSQIPKFHVACQSVVERVYERLVESVHEMSFEFSEAFPTLDDEIRTKCLELLKENAQPTKDLVQRLVQMEGARINLAHPSFVARPEALQSFEKQMQQLARRMGPTYGAGKKIDEVVLEGDAFKRRKGGKGGFFSMWHQRHLLLLRTGDLLWYEPSSTARAAADAKGSIRLHGCVVSRGSSGSTTKASSPRDAERTLQISGGELGDGIASVLLEFADEAEAHTWDKHLKDVIATLVEREPNKDGAASVESGGPDGALGTARSGVLARETDEDRSQIRQLTEMGRLNHYKLTHMLDSYTRIVQQTLCDLVPKAITLHLLDETTQAINTRLDPTLGRGSMATAIAELMAPSAEQAAKLKRLQGEVACLREACAVVAHVRASPASKSSSKSAAATKRMPLSTSESASSQELSASGSPSRRPLHRSTSTNQEINSQPSTTVHKPPARASVRTADGARGEHLFSTPC